MTNLEIGLLIAQVVQLPAIYFLTKYNRDLLIEKQKINEWYDSHTIEREKRIQELNRDKTLLTEQIYSLEKKAKASNDVLEVLHDLKNGGTILHVERIDKNDVYYHNGGQYR